jgi:aspartyl-tRNA(Asn)/glutamyl-tRNA(Gln) amidotransferase subunit B
MSQFDNFEQVIGLEVHVQLNTTSKIFCGTRNGYGLCPNSLTDVVTLGLPGSLPVMNEAVVRHAIMLGLATNCSIRPVTRFARKHYFYPDLPKGYQISQFDEPICENGFLILEESQKKINITRIHIEEDAGKSTHVKNSSLIDYNRAGTPLLEVVSAPDIRSAEEAIDYLKRLYQLVTYLGICNGNMEQGNFRCDANISVRPHGQTDRLGTKTEIKNLNSFKFIEKAILVETKRHLSLIAAGHAITQETVLFDSDTGITKPMRNKEGSADYRYFPDPDLPPLTFTNDYIESIKCSLPELPTDKKRRFRDEFGLSDYDAQVLTATKATADYFEKTLLSKASPKLLCNWIVSELFALLNRSDYTIDQCNVPPEQLGELVVMIENKQISGKIGKMVLGVLFEKGGSPEDLIQSLGLNQISNRDEIISLVKDIFNQHPKQFQQFIEGKDALKGFFVGQVMKISKGTADPEIVNEVIDQLKKQ